MSFGAMTVLVLAAAHVSAGPSALNGLDSAAAHPPPAAVARVTVRAHKPDAHTTMRCVVDVTGHLKDCKITEEHPVGQGFGEASLKVAHRLKVKPALQDGQAVEAAITIPMRWKQDSGSSPNAGTPPLPLQPTLPPPSPPSSH